MSQARIPESWDRNAPHFLSKEPEELQTFLDDMAHLMDLAKTPEKEKSAKLVKYADTRAKREWKGLPSFETGCHKEFLKDVVLRLWHG